ncbi:DUF4397 domain-containing protein [Halegenticoccus soli]|uniref:DUF4397 domain-containing protein n=1 Tax=Halegenticoccus soli TaxID=1985678 RepID=UPI000C6D7049|nr:DUF4397 domain-containing protein [Halegenticoccus soli]
MTSKSNQSRRTVLKAVGAAGALSLVGGTGVAGANEHGGSDDDGGGGNGGDCAAVRVAHASPDAPAVDVYVNGEKVLSNVEFGTVTDYLVVEPGTYTVKITAAGDPETVAFEGDVTLESKFYTVAAVGQLSDGTFEPLVLVDDDVALVRLVHTSPDAPAVDVTVEGADLTLFDGVSFGDQTDYVVVPAGEYTLEVRGDTENDDGDVVATFDVALEPGVQYTAFAIGYLSPENAPADAPDDRAFDLLVATDAGTEPLDPCDLRGDGSNA